VKSETRKTISELAVEVRAVYSDKDANALLAKGWRLYGMPIWSEALTSPVFFLVFLDRTDDPLTN
jgi:hypothetical protein